MMNMIKETRNVFSQYVHCSENEESYFATSTSHSHPHKIQPWIENEVWSVKQIK